MKRNAAVNGRCEFSSHNFNGIEIDSKSAVAPIGETTLQLGPVDAHNWGSYLLTCRVPGRDPATNLQSYIVNYRVDEAQQEGRRLGGVTLRRRPAGDYFFFFLAAFFAGAFFFAAAMVHLSSVLRPLMRPLRNVGASGPPVERACPSAATRGAPSASRYHLRSQQEGSNRD